MSIINKMFYLSLAIFGIIIIPYLGAWVHYLGEFPPDYFKFPYIEAGEKAEFSLPIFINISTIFIILILVYLKPKWFGFHPIKIKRKEYIPKPLPFWFWVGLIMFTVTLWVLWGKFSEPKWLINWAVVPLFWGFTLVLDGIVYVRKGGHSILSDNPRELFAIGVASIPGWLIFEYLNFFIEKNWVYPEADLMSVEQFCTYAVIGSSGLMPMGFEWYSLLKTYKFSDRYVNGPKLSLSLQFKIGLLIVAVLGLFFTTYVTTLFFVLWVAPLIILAVTLDLLKIWTPFTPIKYGNWSPVLLFALTYFIQGFLCEFWNYFSGYYEDGKLITNNPDYWTYSIPYVDVLYVFEMPVLGLLGYFPFGVFCAVWWISFAFLLNIPTPYLDNNHTDV